MAQSPLNIDSRQRWNLGYWMIALLLLMLVQSVWQGSSRVEAVPYSAFEKALAEGRITVRTALGEVTEHIPMAYQEINGERRPVPCHYTQEGTVFGFAPGPHSAEHPLVIDPVLSFSTYSGSSSDNFGYTATYDADGFLYSGSSAFGQGYPTTTGAYQTQHAGGQGLGDGIDVAITKFDTKGQFLIWSTFLGGAGDELPHSMIVNGANELFVYGTTSSLDFPVTSGAYDATFNGGTATNPAGLGANYVNGSDIFIARLGANGDALLASTYIGGSQNDGFNAASGLKHNYADEVRAFARRCIADLADSREPLLVALGGFRDGVGAEDGGEHLPLEAQVLDAFHQHFDHEDARLADDLEFL